MLETDKWPR